MTINALTAIRSGLTAKTKAAARGFLTLIALVSIGVAPALVPTAAKAARAPVVIDYDMGGEVNRYVAKVENLRASGTPVMITGTCVSACTLYLGLANTCVSPQARLGFHGPRSRLNGIPLPQREFSRLTRVMASYYPSQMRGWFLSEAVKVTESYYVLTGSDMIAMGVRSC